MYKQQKPLTVSSGILSLLITALVLAVAASANAQTSSTPLSATSTNTSATSLENTSTTTLSSNQAPASLQDRLNAQKSDIESKRVELASSTLLRKGTLNETKQAQITELIGQYVTSISETILKLRNFSDRLQGEASDFSNQNIDVSTVTNRLNNANYLIREAETALKDVNVNIQYTVTSVTPQTDWQALKSQLQLTNLFIRNAHGELNGILSNLREVTSQTNNPTPVQ